MPPTLRLVVATQAGGHRSLGSEEGWLAISRIKGMSIFGAGTDGPDSEGNSAESSFEGD